MPVGQALIIETFENDLPEVEREWMKDKSINDGKLIHFLISSPTNRVPSDVHNTVNAYLAFRAVLLAGKQDLIQLVVKCFLFFACDFLMFEQSVIL